MKIRSISAFFPMYGDEGTVELMYNRLKKVLGEISEDYEIIMVDDCSPDNSGKIADKIAGKDKKVKVVHHENNKGYGGALKSGFRNATKELIFYTDGDAQYDVSELKKLIPFIGNYDLVNGYKIERGDKWHRKFIGNLYNNFVHLAFNLKVRDVDCDFRLMKAEIFKKVKLKADDGSICVEMMRKIQNAGFDIKNVPVHHYERVYGQSTFFKPLRIVKTLLNLGKLWFTAVLFRKTTDIPNHKTFKPIIYA